MSAIMAASNSLIVNQDSNSIEAFIKLTTQKCFELVTVKNPWKYMATPFNTTNLVHSI